MNRWINDLSMIIWIDRCFICLSSSSSSSPSYIYYHHHHYLYISSSDNFGYSLCKVGHFYSSNARATTEDGDNVNIDDLLVGAPGNSLMAGANPFE